MPSIIDCPSCSRQLRVPDNLAGQQVKCPRCGETFSAGFSAPPPIPAEAAAPPPLPEPPPVPHEAPPLPHDLPPLPEPPPAHSNHKPCPNCGELLDEEATRCRVCGEPLTAPDRGSIPWQELAESGRHRYSQPHRGTMILVFGILSLVTLIIGCIGVPVGLPMGISAWVLGQGDLKKMRRGEMDPSGLGLTQAGWVCGIIGTILQSLGLCLCGLFFSISFATPQRRPVVQPAPRTMRFSTDPPRLRLMDYLPPER